MAGLSIQPNLEQQAALVSRTLISRPNVERLVQMTPPNGVALSAAGTESLVDSMMRSLVLTGDPRTNSYAISYRDTNPQRAREVVSSLLTIFVDTSVGEKRQDTRDTLEFLDAQIKQYEQSLQVAENRLKNFKVKYMGIAGQGDKAGQDFFGRMSQLSDQITNAKLELRAAVESRDSYRRGLAGESAMVPVERGTAGRTTMPSETETRLTAQRTKLDELLRNFTEQHPDVVGTRRVIAELEEQRRAEIRERERIAAANPSRPTEAQEQNPVFQKMRVSLADAEANVASLSAKLAAYEGQYASLKASAMLVPQVEAEFAQLNRDYDIQKKTYGDLLARRQAATMGADVQVSEGTSFRVVEPPRVSSEPLRPSRVMLLWAVFAAALAVGVGASFAANEAWPRFHEARSLEIVAERPLLGTVSIVPSDAAMRRSRRHLALFFGGVGGLVASFAGILVVVLLTARAT